jgi:hypothetical protein
MSKTANNISAGANVICKNKEAVLGAVIKYHGKNSVLTAHHLLKVGGCGLGGMVKATGWLGSVIKIIIDFNLAIIEVKAPESEFNFSQIKKTRDWISICP